MLLGYSITVRVLVGIRLHKIAAIYVYMENARDWIHAVFIAPRRRFSTQMGFGSDNLMTAILKKNNFASNSI